ncbi:MAG TPA: hypothetical protein VGR45_00115, partial [Stellaceae bacterium]|nr:hypothetical protein [Stellaceae bacterium]
MAAGDTLASLGQKVTDLFVGAFANRSPDAALVFLPFALPVPNDIVQAGAQGAQVNPTRMASFLASNFDAPYLMSPTQYTIHGKDLSYGAASQIYTTAVTLARPTAGVDSDAWKRVTAEIAMAQSVLDPGGMAMACEPDDWVMPDNNGYWSAFDSSQTQTAPSPSAAPAPPAITTPPHVINPALWTIKPAGAREQSVPSLAYLHAVYPAAAAPASARPAIVIAGQSAAAAKPAAQPPAHAVPVRAVSPQPVAAHPVDRPLIWRRPLPPPPPPPQPPPSSSTVTAHFEYMAVTVGFTAAGRPTWDGVFLADRGWCIPGMSKGVLLPSPDVAAPSGAAPLAYGLPTALIVIRNLTVAVHWTGQEQASIQSGGYLGPFSLANASATTAADGSSTYSNSGMQVVALLCGRLPALPPVDPPDAAAAAA